MEMVLLTRTLETEESIQGQLQIVDGNGNVVFECKTLELPYRGNQNSISSIPAGTYTISKYLSPTKGEVVMVENVPNRKYIYFHKGNFISGENGPESRGCILVGDSFEDLDLDGIIDIANSKDTFEKMLNVLGDGSYELVISHSEYV